MKTTAAIPAILFAWLASAGCANAQITGRRVTASSAGPYRRVLVCSMDTEADRRAVEESAVKRELNKRPMTATTCSEFFDNMKSSSDEQVRSSFDHAKFDAVLAWHRRPIIQTFDGPGKAKQEPLSLAGLLKDYRRRAMERSYAAVTSDEQAEMAVQEGRQRVEQGEVHILDVRSGSAVWNGRGAVLGSPDDPPEIAAEGLAKSAVRAFISDGLIPQS